MKTISTSCIAVVLLLAVHSGLLAWGDMVHSPSIDEVGHLPAGLSHWQLKRFELYRVNPPLVRLVATFPLVIGENPVVNWALLKDSGRRRLEFPLGKELIAINGERSFRYFTIARWACIPFSLLGGIVCYVWARQLYGTLSGLLAASLWCFSPSILGNAQMITPDTAAAAFGIAACFLFWRWLKQPCFLRTLWAGCGLGFAELTKFTWFLLFVLWPLLWLVWSITEGTRRSRQTWFREGYLIGLMLTLGILIINVGYGFEGSFERLKNYQFISEALGGPLTLDQGSLIGRNRFATGWFSALPVPLPKNYLLGIDEQKYEFERTMRSYLCGKWQDEGWWYYYAFGLLLKEPLGTWLLVAFACTVSALGWGTGVHQWRDEMIVLVPMIAVFDLVSSQTGFSHHLRYVLPILPFAFVWISKVLTAQWRLARTCQVLSVCALVWSTTSSLAIYPHSLSYFNELAGGPRGGHAYLVDSNIDWGQDLLYLKSWLDAHPEARPLGLAYFGYFDPRIAGIEFTLPPQWPLSTPIPPGIAIEKMGPCPGWYAVSVTLLRGHQFMVPDGYGRYPFFAQPCFTYFQRFQPVAMAGYSIYIYHITLDEANTVRADLGLPLLPPQSPPKEP